MIVYHGSNVIADHPDIKYSFRALDFGKGFYVTTIKERAERWARRKALKVSDRTYVLNTGNTVVQDRSKNMLKDPNLLKVPS